MNCTECRDRLLEADAAVLRGEDDHEVAAHLGQCAACSSLASLLLDQERQLRAALDALTPAGAPAAAVLAAARESRSRRQRRRWVALAPVAAAAGLAALLLGRSAAPSGMPTTTLRQAPPPLVETSNQNVVVYQTDNPDIVVIWLYPSDRSGT